MINLLNEISPPYETEGNRTVIFDRKFVPNPNVGRYTNVTNVGSYFSELILQVINKVSWSTFQVATSEWIWKAEIE